MTEETFWHIIENRKKWKLLDPTKITFFGRQGNCPAESWPEDVFKQNLATLEANEIISFASFWFHHTFRPPESDLWAAAYLIEQGCSDDCFMDCIRPGAVLLGRERFENLVNDIESLADLPMSGHELIAGEFGQIVFSAYRLKTGCELPDDLPKIPRTKDALGKVPENWDVKDLPTLLPKLWAKVRHEWGTELPGHP
jgi:hypothetical protein